MFCLFDINGNMKTNVAFFKRSSPMLKWGQLTDIHGRILKVGTYYNLEKTSKIREIIEIT